MAVACLACGASEDLFGPSPKVQYCDPCWQTWAATPNAKGPAKKRATTPTAGGPAKKKRKTGEAAAAAPKKLPKAIMVRRPPPPFAHRFVCAPMVGGSELAFRLLCRRHGADTCYTPMMYSGRFVESAEYRKEEFDTCKEDRPLVAHFCGNDAATLCRAAELVQDQVDAVDLNLGCPQRIAHTGHFGSYLLGQQDRALVLGIVKHLSANLKVPVFCKIRLLDKLEETIEFAKQLEEAGCALLAVHGRYRGTPTRRRDGPADLAQVGEVKKVLSIPVLSNGNTITAEDVLQNLSLTKADGIMSAEGLLDDPALFRRPAAVLAKGDARKEVKRLAKKLRQAEQLAQRAEKGAKLSAEETTKAESATTLKREMKKLEKAQAPEEGGEEPGEAVEATPESRLSLALEYLKLVEEHPVGAPPSTMAFHVRRMCKKEFAKFQLAGDLAREGSTLEGIRGLVKRALKWEKNGDYVYDPAKAKAEEEAAAFRKYELDCRRKFEARMAKRAKRERKDVDELLRATKVPGGQNFGKDPSWLAENTA